MFEPGDEAGWNGPTNFERRARELQDETDIRVIGVNKDSEKIRVAILEDDDSARSRLDEKARNWCYAVEQVDSENGAVLLELEDDIEEELDF